MSTRGRFTEEINQIESIAETKGIDLDDITVRETETDEGDELIVFRILETKADTEEDSVGVQVSKMPSVQTGEMTFRTDVQNKLTALKRHLSGRDASEDATGDVEQETDDASDTTTDTTSRTRTSGDANGPGAEIDARIRTVEQRLDDLESRVEEIEDKADALDGLQKLMHGDESS